MNIEELIGKTLVKVDGEVGSKEIRFTVADGSCYRMFHRQDCCENVVVEDICGDLEDLVGSPVVRAEESCNNSAGPNYEVGDDHTTWTFYRIATAEGLVVIRWAGRSNGYYSESVDFERVE